MADLDERLYDAFGRRFTEEEIARMPIPAQAMLSLVELLHEGATGRLLRNAPAAYFRVGPDEN